MKRVFLLLAILFFVYFIQNAQKNYGLRFKSKEVVKKDRTGLDLTKNGAISYNSSFEIKFDLSFRKFQDFGYIFRLKELKSQNQIDLICKLHEPSAGLYLVFNKQETKVKINLENIIRKPTNEWGIVEVKFNADSGIVQLCFEGQEITEPIKFPLNSEFVIGFGVVENYGFDTKEVPYISIRNISIFTDGQEKYHWPLNNHSGNTILDTINQKEASISNPEWEVYHHSKWKYYNDITIQGKAHIAYDEKNETIYFVGENRNIYYLNLKENNFDSIKCKGLPADFDEDNYFIVDENSELIAYSHSENKLSRYDVEKQEWNPEIIKHDSLPKYWHHNKLINPMDSNIVTICGYGFYKYQNDILCNKNSNNGWEVINFKGDTIYPRYLSGFGKNPNNNFQCYLFGGLGNKSGDQILGTEFYYDLYQIDFKDSIIKRVWQLDYKGLNDITPINSLIIDKSENHFYTLCFSHQDENTYLRVFKASLTTPDYSFMGDSIPYYFVDTQSYADLFYWPSSKKLVAVTLSQSGNNTQDIRIYTLKFPPGSISIEESNVAKNWLLKKNIGILIGFVLSLTILIAIYNRKKKKTQNLFIENGSENNNEILAKRIKAAPNKASSINLFGGFQVFDKKGKDITYRFSPTLKELFLLMLLHSFKSSKGISSIKIQEILWPDKSPTSAKNNRGVNIKKLRTVLPDIGNIQILYESPYWKLELDEEVFCDYYFASKFLNEQIDQSTADISEYYNLLGYLKRGNMLTNIETEWLDKFKSEMSTKIVQFLERKLQNANLKEDANYILGTVDIISQFDQLNETSLNYKCKALNYLGEHGLVLNTYNNYIKLYQNAYGEEYKISLKEIIKA